jgi:MoxR-like ATPase
MSESVVTADTPLTPREIEREAKQFQETVAAIRAELRKVIIGQDAVIARLIMGLFLQGHVLLEGLPGLAKTLLLKSLSRVLNLEFKRIQFTPDLMPADIIGTRILQQEGAAVSFTFERGPVFTNLLLADEINRASPKTQSALLEAMQEWQVTTAGTTTPLPRPFMVLATQNPIEMEGTYPLPEAQLDRFLFKLDVPYPDQLELVEIALRTTGAPGEEPQIVVESAASLRRWMDLIRRIPVARPILDYCAKIVLATHPDTDSELARKYIRFGASPRGMQALVLAAKARAFLLGRATVVRDDVIDVANSCLSHRIILNFDAEGEGIRISGLVEQLLRQVRLYA